MGAEDRGEFGLVPHRNLQGWAVQFGTDVRHWMETKDRCKMELWFCVPVGLNVFEQPRRDLKRMKLDR